MKNKKMKKITILLLCIFYFSINIIQTKALDLNVSARNAIALDPITKIVLYEKNGDQIVSIASTTKIITALVALKYGNLEQKIEISSAAASIRGSTVGYKKGELITLKELLYGLMLRSGNDAAIAIAEGVGKSKENFLELMNEYALEIGLLNSHFESPHGLDSENHYSTAYDLALATAKARENKEFNEIVSTKDIDASKYSFTRGFHNINKILWQLPDANGVKTGFTGNAGKCLVTSTKVKGKEVIIVVLNCTERWKETERIQEYVAKNYEFKPVAQKGLPLGKITVQDKKKEIDLISNVDILIPMKTGANYKTEIVKPVAIALPIYKGQELGCIKVFKEDVEIFSKTLIANNTVETKKSIIKWLQRNKPFH